LTLDRRDEGSWRAHSRLRRSFLRTRRNKESGQALVEFALIVFPLLLIVVGILQFGIALNYWLDMQRMSNQGARWAAVDCGKTPALVCNPTLEGYLEQQALSKGNNPDVTICYGAKTGSPVGTAGVGDPITVTLNQPFELLPILGIGHISLHASTTMRLEQKPTQGGLPAYGLCP
jgi:hypothetical protein